MQLVELIKLQRASGGRAWVVAFRRKNPQTILYAPSALYGKQTPVSLEASRPENFLQDARSCGVAWCGGYDYAAIAGVIVQTAA